VSNGTPDWVGPVGFVAPFVIGGALGYLTGEDVCSGQGAFETCTRAFNRDAFGIGTAAGFAITAMFEFAYADNVVAGIAAIVVGGFCFAAALAMF
jgi:hypothetical protein